MGKTKTVVIDETLEKGKKTSLQKLKEKRERQEAARKKKGVKVPGLKGGERVVAVEAEVVVEKESEESASAEATTRREPKVRGKKHKDASAKVDKNNLYSLREAIKLVKETSYSKFDGTLELHVLVKKKGLNTQVTLPFSTGKEKKIEVASEATIKKLKDGKIDFDVLLTTKEMMSKLVPFAKTLGPKGLMPNPKNGTIIKTKADAKKFSGNSLTIKTEKKAPVIHSRVGKVSQKASELEENTKAIITAIGSKQIIRAHLAPTMGPSVKLQVA